MSDARFTIGIDARKIRDFGIGRYLQGLLEGLADTTGDERFVILTADAKRESLPGRLPELLDPQRFGLEPFDAPLYSVREILAFRGLASRLGLDLLHLPHYVRGIFPGCPFVATIHDAIHLSHPPSKAAALYARAMMTWTARTATLLFADSRSARDDIAERIGVSSEKFRVTPLAAGPSFVPPSDESLATLRRDRDLGSPFLLILGSHRPHKNLAAAVAAAGLAGLDPVDVVVPARDSEAAARLTPIVGRAGRVETPVEDADLPRFYAAARLVLVPSLAEGFGLPPLEAAACGAAVVATPIPPHREVLDGAVAWADSGSSEDLSRAIRRMWRDDDGRATLREAGPRVAARFRWEDTARATRAGYRAALGLDPPRASEGPLL